MSKVVVELCPETGICSLVKENGAKADLMPDEVAALRDAGNAPDKIKDIVAGSDAAFAAGLSDQELIQIASRLA